MDDPDIQRIKQMARSLIESEKSEAITEAAELLNPPYAPDLIRRLWRERPDRLGTLRILR
jgi:hypothetical protein